MDKPKNLIKIRDIKNLLIKGTNVKYQHGDFAKRLLVDGSLLLSSEEFDNDIVGSSVFSSFVGGNLRQLNNGKWGYAIVGVTERLERLNLEYEDEYDECYIYVCFYNAFKNNILPHLKIEISKESDYDAYLMLVYKKISELVKKENTYYLELYDDITNMIVNKELYKALALLCMISIFQDKVCLFFSDKYRTRWSDKGFFLFSQKLNLPQTHLIARKQPILILFRYPQLIFLKQYSLMNLNLVKFRVSIWLFMEVLYGYMMEEKMLFSKRQLNEELKYE
jgi:hypothetical protein